MFKRFFTVLSIVAIAFSFSIPMTGFASEASYSENENSVDWKYATDISVDKEQIEMAEKLSNYFVVDEEGNTNFTADKETLMEMGISKSDAEIMTSISSDELTFDETQEDQQLQGFVGLHLKLGPKVRAMTAVVAGAFAAGYIGWHVKKIAAAGPWGAGAAAAITASAAGIVGWAVNKGLTQVDVGVNVPSVSLSFNVNIP